MTEFEFRVRYKLNPQVADDLYWIEAYEKFAKEPDDRLYSGMLVRRAGS
jgi:hypothetical protein